MPRHLAYPRDMKKHEFISLPKYTVDDKAKSGAVLVHWEATAKYKIETSMM